MSQDPKVIHETIVRDIVEFIADGAKKVDFEDGGFAFGKGKTSFRSITKASSNLICTFPVLISDTVPIEQGIMIMKSHERKCATMLQMLFSALCVSSDEENVYQYLQNFHTNLNFDDDDLNVDNFIDTMDSVADRATEESAKLSRFIFEEATKMILEDHPNIDYVLSTDIINETGLNDYRVMSTNTNFNSCKVMAPILEGKNKNRSGGNGGSGGNNGGNGGSGSKKGPSYNDLKVKLAAKTAELDALKKNGSYERREYKETITKREDIEKAKLKAEYLKGMSDFHKNQVIATDVNKANELIPTMMVIQFHSPESDVPVTAVVGIKAKLYPIPSDEVINRLLVRNKDNQGFHNFLRAATREISFFKDFVFAVDKAKIDALSSSRRGSDSKIWKLLERRATKSKLKRAFGMRNDATAITTLCISNDEVEMLKKEYSVDVNKIPIIRPIMDAYNLMGFIVLDDNIEQGRFLYDDGSNKFETYSYRSLEKESGNQDYKKIINLMTKMVR